MLDFLIHVTLSFGATFAAPCRGTTVVGVSPHKSGLVEPLGLTFMPRRNMARITYRRDMGRRRHGRYQHWTTN